MTTENKSPLIIIDLREEMSAMAKEIKMITEFDKIPHVQNDIAKAVHDLYLTVLLYNGFPVVPEGEDLDQVFQQEINYGSSVASYGYDQMCEDEEDDPKGKDNFFSALSERRFDLLMSAHADICKVFFHQGIYFNDEDAGRSLEVQTDLVLSEGLWIIQNVQ